MSKNIYLHLFLVNDIAEPLVVHNDEIYNSYIIVFNYTNNLRTQMIDLERKLITIINEPTKITNIQKNYAISYNETTKQKLLAVYCNEAIYNAICTLYKLQNIKKLLTSNPSSYHNLIIKNNNNKLAVYDIPKMKIRSDDFFNIIYSIIDDNNTKQFLLSDNDIISRLENFPLCNFTLFKNLVYNLNEIYGESINLNLGFFLVNGKFKENRIINNFYALYYYFWNINNYFNRDYIIYSLGSSLEKMNYLWNIKNIDQIKIIPFTGNAIHHPSDDDK